MVGSGVKRWQDPELVGRWVGTATIEVQRSFRRITGSQDVKPLADVVRAEVTRLVDGEWRTATPPTYDQAA